MSLITELVQSYQHPFFDVTRDNPNLETMKKVVVVEKHRPTLMQSWYSHKVSGLHILSFIVNLSSIRTFTKC